MAKANKFTGGGVNQNKAAMMQRVQQMQEEMERVQNEISESTVEATAGGGAVSVVMKGSHELVSVKLKPEIVDPDDIEMLEDLIVAAVNEAEKKASEMMEEGMAGITGGLNIPGLF
ncbi:MAG: YbaB/EbfC family nucleoid-associated protein [Ruminococcaceae bacterium]|nr:YbaB/EbfC family nucleoid-associated protein [Oscillospiraceae bacterium]